MAIHIPGRRRKKGRSRLMGHAVTKRNAVAVLQLTAMVDMFTVLVVFLLQNYASTNQILPISDQLELPKAASTKELKPSFVVVLSDKHLSFNEKKVSTFNQVKTSKDWLIQPLFLQVKEVIDEIDKKFAEEKGSSATESAEESKEDQKDVPIQYKITLQADSNIDFLSIKKILYTLTEAGVREINFAVVKVKPEDKYGVL